VTWAVVCRAASWSAHSEVAGAHKSVSPVGSMWSKLVANKKRPDQAVAGRFLIRVDWLVVCGNGRAQAWGQAWQLATQLKCHIKRSAVTIQPICRAEKRETRKGKCPTPSSFQFLCCCVVLSRAVATWFGCGTPRSERSFSSWSSLYVRISDKSQPRLVPLSLTIAQISLVDQ